MGLASTLFHAAVSRFSVRFSSFFLVQWEYRLRIAGEVMLLYECLLKRAVLPDAAAAVNACEMKDRFTQSESFT